MPTYDMICDGTDCKLSKQKIEIYCSVKELEHQYCESCGQRMRIVPVVNTGFILNGGGWFKDGY